MQGEERYGRSGQEELQPGWKEMRPMEKEEREGKEKKARLGAPQRPGRDWWSLLDSPGWLRNKICGEVGPR